MSQYVPITKEEVDKGLVGVRILPLRYSAPKHFCETCKKEINHGQKAIFTGNKSYHDNGKCFNLIVPPTAKPR